MEYSLMPQNVVHQAESSKDENITYCEKCDKPIPQERVYKNPKGKVCVHCHGTNYPKQTISEPLGTRKDYEKDRKSWINEDRY